MAKQRDLGIAFIGYADPVETVAGFTPTLMSAVNWTELTNLVPDSIKNVDEQGTLTDFKNAENDKVDFSFKTSEDVKKFEFSTFDMDLKNKVLAFGGTVSDGAWYAPTSAYNGTEKSLIIISRSVKGLYAVRVYARVKLIASEVGEFTNEAVNNIKFSGTVLSPEDSGTGLAFTSALNYHKAIAPTIASYNATSGVLSWEYIDGFESATDFEYSKDAGLNWIALATNPETIATAQAAVLVRVEKFVSSDLGLAQWQPSASLSAVVTP